MRGWIFVIALLLPAAAPGAALDAREIIARSVAANKADWKAQAEYSYMERVRDGGETRTYEVIMILGSPYKRLVRVNGKPLSPEQNAEQERELAKTIAERRAESPEQRAQRIAGYEKDRKRDHDLMEQLTVAFDFELLGQRRLGNYDVYVLRATPRPGYQPPNVETQVLTGMKGKLWIDTKTFQWVKVEAQVVHPVSIEGFLARVEPGTYFELEKTPVEDGLWMPAHFQMKSKSKVLFLFNHKTQEDKTYFDYRRTEAAHGAGAP
ncbi:MAG: hypothetical protein M1541_19830 [Acidobacteria bacterium]|nr:hypothetical protein [Acidobacteriota bacterium]